jgi:hypothetical protein
VITFGLIAVLTLACTSVVAALHNRREVRRALRQVESVGEAGRRLPILIPVSGRPHYLRQVVDGLSRVHGIEGALLVFSQDRRDPEVSSIISGVDFADVVIIEHARPFLGVLASVWDSDHVIGRHIRFLLEFAFDDVGAEHAILVEDDIVPGPDLLRYFSWACRYVLSDERVLAVSGFNLHSRVDQESGFDPRRHPHDLVEARDESGRLGFTGCGWAISRRQWARIRRDWSDWNWDHHLTRTQHVRGLVSFQPVLARTKHIGMQGGINCTEVEGNPKWLGVMLDEGPYGDAPPNFLPDLPARPAYEDVKAAVPPPNERRRTRPRRLQLVALIVLLAVAELVAWRALTP